MTDQTNSTRRVLYVRRGPSNVRTVSSKDPVPDEERETGAGRNRLTAGDLLKTNLPGIHMLVPGLIVRGLTLMLVGPRVDGADFCLRLALGVASGDSVLGRESQQPARVLYYSLRHSPSAMRTRLAKLGVGELALGNLVLDFASPGEVGLEAAARDTPGFALVVIDPITRFYPSASMARGPRTVSTVLSWLAEVAHRNGIAIIAVFHTEGEITRGHCKRLNPEESADATLMLSRPQQDLPLRLRLIGRDIQQMDYTLDDRASGTQLLTDFQSEPPSPIRSAILSVLSPTQPPLSPTNILERLPDGLCTLGSLKYHIEKLLRSGALVRVSYGRYTNNLRVAAQGEISLTGTILPSDSAPPSNSVRTMEGAPKPDRANFSALSSFPSSPNSLDAPGSPAHLALEAEAAKAGPAEESGESEEPGKSSKQFVGLESGAGASQEAPMRRPKKVLKTRPGKI